MGYDLKRMRQASQPIAEYLKSASHSNPAFAQRYGEYRVDASAIEELKGFGKGYMIIAFSAEWCKDCARNVPVLGLISEAAGLEVRVFGHLMRDPLNPTVGWRIPPSPPEVREFNVTKIPFIVVLDMNGEKVGEIVENAPEGLSLEGAILKILKRFNDR